MGCCAGTSIFDIVVTGPSRFSEVCSPVFV